jgi:hypothetical protein
MSVIQPPADIISKFNKQYFKPGDAVCFTWFNTKGFGYVIKTSQSNWGIMYTIQLGKRKYPCGIQIGEWKTKYETGLLQYSITKQYTTDELNEFAANSGDSLYETVTFRRVSRDDENTAGGAGDTNVDTKKDTTIPKAPSRRNNKVSRANVDVSNNDVQQNGSEEPIAIDVSPIGSNGVQQRNTKKRSKTPKNELNDAIQKQKDFLSGFVKKD